VRRLFPVIAVVAALLLIGAGSASARVTRAHDRVLSNEWTVTRWAYTTTYYPPGLYVIQPWLAMSGGQILSPDGTRASGYLNSPATVQAFTFWGDLYAKRQLAPVQPPPDLFGTGQAVFMQGNPFVLRDLAQRFPGFRVGVTYLPKDRRCATNTGAYHIGISSQTKQRDPAWELVNTIAGAVQLPRLPSAEYHCAP